MSEASFINTALYRPLKNGNQYNKYFNKSKCNYTELKTGDTYTTLNLMQSLAKKYKSQSLKISELFKNKSIKQVSEEIYSFLYHHIQYNKDLEDQLLRSPNCAWSSRKEGLDCKSYALFASTILQNLNINHFFRKIDQSNDGLKSFSHVYVVISEDQTKTELTYKDPVYVIDPTTHNNNEPYYFDKHDVVMSLKHYSLNGAKSTPNPQKAMLIEQKELFLNSIKSYLSTQDYDALYNHIANIIKSGNTPVYTKTNTGYTVSGANIVLSKRNALNGDATGEEGDVDVSQFEDLFSNIDFSSIGSIFAGLNCLGGTAYSDFFVNADKGNFGEIIKNLIININASAYNKDMANLSLAISDFYAYTVMIEAAATAKRIERGWNTCSSQNIDNFIGLAAKVRNFGNAALTAWLSDNFTWSDSSQLKTLNSSLIDGLFVGNVTPKIVSQDVIRTINIKDPLKPIPAFVYNPELAHASNTGQFNANDYLNTLNDIIVPAINTPAGTNPTNTPINNGPTVQQAGTGIIGKVIITGLVASGIYAAYKNADTKAPVKKSKK